MRKYNILSSKIAISLHRTCPCAPSSRFGFDPQRGVFSPTTGEGFCSCRDSSRAAPTGSEISASRPGGHFRASLPQEARHPCKTLHPRHPSIPRIHREPALSPCLHPFEADRTSQDPGSVRNGGCRDNPSSGLSRPPWLSFGGWLPSGQARLRDHHAADRTHGGLLQQPRPGESWMKTAESGG